MNSSFTPHLAADLLRSLGAGLVRPECVLTTATGHAFASDWRGGVSEIDPNGRVRLHLGTAPDGVVLRPNGIALLSDGSFLLAQLGDTDGGVYRLERSGVVTPWLLEVDGTALPPTNFVLADGAGRFWITVSTRRQPRDVAYRRDGGDGFIVLVDAKGARVVADGIGYTNEVAIHPSGRWLYVNETFARRLSRFALADDGSLGARETVTEFGAGTFPDGLAFDEEGFAWVVSVVSNRLIRVAPDGQPTIWFEDSDAEHLAWVEAAFDAGTMGRPHLDRVGRTRLQNISSIAFLGADRRTGVLGCLKSDHLVTLPLPAAGVQPAHWNYSLHR